MKELTTEMVQAWHGQGIGGVSAGHGWGMDSGVDSGVGKVGVSMGNACAVVRLGHG